MFDYVCVNKEVDLLSNRVKVLETLSGFKKHVNVIKSCIFIQRNAKKIIFNSKLRNLRERTSKRIIRFHTNFYIKTKNHFRKKLLAEALKNKLKTIYYRKRFLKIKSSSIYIQYMFRKSFKNNSYSLKCNLLREIQYLNQKISAKNYVINELRKKIKKEQSNTSKMSNEWYRKNILKNLINTDAA